MRYLSSPVQCNSLANVAGVLFRLVGGSVGARILDSFSNGNLKSAPSAAGHVATRSHH